MIIFKNQYINLKRRTFCSFTNLFETVVMVVLTKNVDVWQS